MFRKQLLHHRFTHLDLMLLSQQAGNLLADAVNGFPVPFYPLCLQRAHEYAALVDFDLDILQDQFIESIRTLLGADAPVLDSFRLQLADPAQARY